MHVLLDKPYLLFPLFVLEEMGLPIGFASGTLFMYVGFLLSTGQGEGLALVPINVGACILGAMGVYWFARAGTDTAFWKTKIAHRLPGIITKVLEGGRNWGFLSLVIGRLAPIPTVLVDAAFGAVRVNSMVFASGVFCTALAWNVLYVVAGYLSGLVTLETSPSAPLWIRYGPEVLVRVLVIVGVFWFHRRRSKASKAQAASSLVTSR